MRKDSESPCEDLERVERCYNLLLDAGSDISSITQYGVLSMDMYEDDPDTFWSAFGLALYEGTLVRRPFRDSVDAMQLIIFRQD